MLGTVLYGRRDIRFEARNIPFIEKPTDAVIRMARDRVRRSDLWDYRGINKVPLHLSNSLISACQLYPVRCEP